MGFHRRRMRTHRFSEWPDLRGTRYLRDWRGGVLLRCPAVITGALPHGSWGLSSVLPLSLSALHTVTKWRTDTQPLTAPATRPLVMRPWTMTKKMITGIATIADAAIT